MTNVEEILDDSLLAQDELKSIRRQQLADPNAKNRGSSQQRLAKHPADLTQTNIAEP